MSSPPLPSRAWRGDLDIATIPALRERLLSIFRPGMRLLIIDLSGVSFCDVSALAMLDGAQRHSTWLGITVRRAAPPQTAKLLRVTGLVQSFTIRATVDDALPVAERPAPGRALPPAISGSSLTAGPLPPGPGRPGPGGAWRAKDDQASAREPGERTPG
jgi:anti-anti-sigma factor